MTLNVSTSDQFSARGRFVGGSTESVPMTAFSFLLGGLPRRRGVTVGTSLDSVCECTGSWPTEDGAGIDVDEND